MIRYWCAAVIFLVLFACSDKHREVSAPINDKPTLEKLAKAYTEIRSDMPISPTGLNPAGKRKFVEKVFLHAGYNYGATIVALAQVPEQSQSQYYRDLVELALMPANGLASAQYGEIFSAEEIEAIGKIKGHGLP